MFVQLCWYYDYTQRHSQPLYRGALCSFNLLFSQPGIEQQWIGNIFVVVSVFMVRFLGQLNILKAQKGVARAASLTLEASQTNQIGQFGFTDHLGSQPHGWN